MKRIVCFLICLCLLLGGSGCTFSSPEEVLYENLISFTPQFDLWTEDASGVFTTVLTEHPELQVYVGKVKTSASNFKQSVSVEYQNTDVLPESVSVGREEEIAVTAFKEMLDAVKERGVMVLLGSGEQPDPQVWLDAVAEEHYLSYMGLTDTGWTFYSNDFTEDVVVICQAQYSMDAATLMQYRQQSETEVQRLSTLLWNEESDPEAKVLAIHDHLIENANYVEKDTPADHTPYNILLEGRGVCDGYAYAAKLLLDAAGVENRIVTGTADGGDHRWNLIKLGDHWYHMDVTWDDPISTDGKEHHTYDYYLKSDATMAAEHSWEGDYPACAEDYKS